jgi:hypothetical protein
MLLAALALGSTAALALSREAEEFMAITRELEPLQCEKRKLRREIALAEAERRDASELRARFDKLDRDPQTSALEKRLAELEPKLRASRDRDDLAAISRQQRDAFYRCQ